MQHKVLCLLGGGLRCSKYFPNPFGGEVKACDCLFSFVKDKICEVYDDNLLYIALKIMRKSIEKATMYYHLNLIACCTFYKKWVAKEKNALASCIT